MKSDLTCFCPQTSQFIIYHHYFFSYSAALFNIIEKYKEKRKAEPYCPNSVAHGNQGTIACLSIALYV
jgi:hypothetical protein